MTLEFLTDPDLRPIRHGFFTRRLGVSEGIYAGLNCAQNSDDDPQHVAINRARVAQDAAVEPEALLSLHQVHSSDVVTVTKAGWDGERPDADAMVTKTPGIALGILTADCAPVLFADKTAKIVGAAHAGWGGALKGVLENTIDAMIALGATRKNIIASVGPCISQKAYEVGPEFLQNFTDTNPDYSRFFIAGENDRLLFDLPNFILHRLQEAGINSASWIERCTFSEPRSFYSYRRSTHAKEPDYGRQISLIRL